MLYTSAVLLVYNARKRLTSHWIILIRKLCFWGTHLPRQRWITRWQFFFFYSSDHALLVFGRVIAECKSVGRSATRFLGLDWVRVNERRADERQAKPRSTMCVTAIRSASLLQQLQQTGIYNIGSWTRSDSPTTKQCISLHTTGVNHAFYNHRWLTLAGHWTLDTAGHDDGHCVVSISSIVGS